MSTQTPLHSDWYRATTLVERLAATPPDIQPDPVNAARSPSAERRLQRWRSQPPFALEPFFAQRLAMDGVTGERLLDLLNEPSEAVAQRFPDPPGWLTTFVSAFAQPVPDLPIALPEPLQDVGFAQVLDVIKPLLHHGRRRVRAGIRSIIQTYPNALFDPATIEDILFAALPQQLLEMLLRTTALELNVARMQGLLPGDTPRARFESFLARLREHEMLLDLLREYPVLARQIVTSIDQWVRFSLELLKHLARDSRTIRATFMPPDDPGTIARIDGQMGDRHRDGRSVQIITWSSGFRLVYKPKSLAADLHFQELLAWLNERGVQPGFRLMKILDQGSYGWCEFIAAEPCASPAAVERFYERQGSYLALLHGLAATDFHYENLIASGEHPILLDLEALFHPSFGQPPAVDDTDARARRLLEESVLGVGLLPERFWANDDYDGAEISGLGMAADQLTPQLQPFWEGVGTDALRLTRKRTTMPAGQNQPTLQGTRVDVVTYRESIITGFRRMYRLLMKHRHELLAPDSPLMRFAGDEVRVFVRSTRSYGILLRESFHPDVLRDALDRERYFDHLWLGVTQQPYLAAFIPAERAALQRGDIPMFTTRPGADDVWSDTGTPISGVIGTPGLEVARRRLHDLSEANLAHQAWLIRASLTALPVEHAAVIRSSDQVAPAQRLGDAEQLIAAARAIGDHLESIALRDHDSAHWLGLRQNNERYWAIIPLGIDLYGGLPGVALFLAYLGSISGEARYTELAQHTLPTMRRILERSRATMTGLGAFEGWGSIIYALTHLGTLWEQPALVAEAESLVDLIRPLVEQDVKLDILGGSAGCIISLLNLYRCAPSPRTLSVATQCGDWLLARSRTMEQGIGWMNHIKSPRPLVGFAHGAAGIALALLELAAATGEARFHTAAEQAIAYERGLFLPALGTWADPHHPTTDAPAPATSLDHFIHGWCYGAPGIGLARLATLRHLDDPLMYDEIHAATAVALKASFGYNHSLCHGDLGNLELLMQARAVSSDADLLPALETLTSSILEHIRQRGWMCAVPMAVETPGLMIGLAGIGYGLLRLARPAHVPSVLQLAPPMTARSA